MSVDKVSFRGFTNASVLALFPNDGECEAVHRLLLNVNGKDAKIFRKILKNYKYQLPEGVLPLKKKPILQIDLFEFTNKEDPESVNVAFGLNGHQLDATALGGNIILTKIAELMKTIEKTPDNKFVVTNNFKKHFKGYTDYFSDLGLKKEDLLSEPSDEIHDAETIKGTAGFIKENIEVILSSMKKNYNLFLN